MPTYRDAVPINEIQFDNMPEVARWPITVGIKAITLIPTPDGGYAFELDWLGGRPWPDSVTQGWDGPLQYTVWMGTRILGKWVIGGFIQMWSSRPSTGAPLTSQYKDWAYDTSRWPTLSNLFTLLPGTDVIMMVVAGNTRGGQEYVPETIQLQERSNIIRFTLPEPHVGTFYTPLDGNETEEPKEPTNPTLPPIDTTEHKWTKSEVNNLKQQLNNIENLCSQINSNLNTPPNLQPYVDSISVNLAAQIGGVEEKMLHRLSNMEYVATIFGQRITFKPKA